MGKALGKICNKSKDIQDDTKVDIQGDTKVDKQNNKQYNIHIHNIATNDDTLYILSCHFNPQKFKRRKQLSQQFIDQFQNANANFHMIFIECAIEGDNFELYSDSNTITMIQVQTKHVMWLKENLLNIALKRVPQNTKNLVWCDADIFFEEPIESIIEKINKTLEEYPVAQLFEYAVDLHPDGKQTLGEFESFGSFVVKNKEINRYNYNQSYPHPGYGWAIRLQVLLNTNGFFEYNIVGNGDSHMSFSFINRAYESYPTTQNEKDYPQIQQELLKWQSLAYIITQGNVGFVPITIKHGWHGNKEDRGYMDRWQILLQNNFNPYVDIIKNQCGVFEFTKQGEKMINMIKKYFQQRNEDEESVKPTKYPQINKNQQLQVQKLQVGFQNPQNQKSQSSNQNQTVTISKNNIQIKNNYIGGNNHSNKNWIQDSVNFSSDDCNITQDDINHNAINMNNNYNNYQNNDYHNHHHITNYHSNNHQQDHHHHSNQHNNHDHHDHDHHQDHQDHYSTIY